MAVPRPSSHGDALDTLARALCAALADAWRRRLIADADVNADQRAALAEFTVARTGLNGETVWLSDEVDGCRD